MTHRDFIGLARGDKIRRYKQGLASLTARERQVFIAVLQNREPSKIAQEMAIKKSTVDSYRAKILRRLGLKSIVELQIFAGIVGFSVA